MLTFHPWQPNRRKRVCSALSYISWLTKLVLTYRASGFFSLFSEILPLARKKWVLLPRTPQNGRWAELCVKGDSVVESKAEINRKVICFFIIRCCSVWLIRGILLPFLSQIVMSRECEINWKFFFPLRYPNGHMAGLILPVSLITNKKKS